MNRVNSLVCVVPVVVRSVLCAPVFQEHNGHKGCTKFTKSCPVNATDSYFKIYTMQNISVEELKARMDAGEKLNLVDCREPHEHADFNIGAQLIPLGKFQAFQVEELDDMKDEEIIIYCRSGVRSAQACLLLDTMGFKSTKNLTGGILAWQERYSGKSL